MKKRLCIVLIVLLALLLLPHAASANAPVPDPNEVQLDYRGVPEGTTLTVLTADTDRTLFEVVARTENGRLTFLDPEESDFYVRLTAPDGTVAHTGAIRFESRGRYRYDGKTGVLEKGSYLTENAVDAGAVLMLIIGVFALFLALNVTILIELLIGLCFRLRRIYRVVIINLFTNPVMNILLLLLTLSISGGRIYWIALITLEMIVCGVEFWYYARKYRDHKKWVLLIFTLAANAASAAAGLLPVRLLLR